MCPYVHTRARPYPTARTRLWSAPYGASVVFNGCDRFLRPLCVRSCKYRPVFVPFACVMRPFIACAYHDNGHMFVCACAMGVLVGPRVTLWVSIWLLIIYTDHISIEKKCFGLRKCILCWLAPPFVGVSIRVRPCPIARTRL